MFLYSWMNLMFHIYSIHTFLHWELNLTRSFNQKLLETLYRILTPTCAAEIEILLSKIKKSATLDNLLLAIYKKVKHILSFVISDLLNLIIREETFPTCPKVGWIILILKSGKKYQLKKYRPDTRLPVLFFGSQCMYDWICLIF